MRRLLAFALRRAAVVAIETARRLDPYPDNPPRQGTRRDAANALDLARAQAEAGRPN